MFTSFLREKKYINGPLYFIHRFVVQLINRRVFVFRGVESPHPIVSSQSL